MFDEEDIADAVNATEKEVNQKNKWNENDKLGTFLNLNKQITITNPRMGGGGEGGR